MKKMRTRMGKDELLAFGNYVEVLVRRPMSATERTQVASFLLDVRNWMTIASEHIRSLEAHIELLEAGSKPLDPCHVANVGGEESTAESAASVDTEGEELPF